MNDLASLTIRQLSQEMQAGRLTATELTEYFLERSERLAAHHQWLYLLTRDKALATACHVDSLRRQTGSSPLAGIPMAVKDNIAVRGGNYLCLKNTGRLHFTL